MRGKGSTQYNSLQDLHKMPLKYCLHEGLYVHPQSKKWRLLTYCVLYASPLKAATSHLNTGSNLKIVAMQL